MEDRKSNGVRRKQVEYISIQFNSLDLAPLLRGRSGQNAQKMSQESSKRRTKNEEIRTLHTNCLVPPTLSYIACHHGKLIISNPCPYSNLL